MSREIIYRGLTQQNKWVYGLPGFDSSGQIGDIVVMGTDQAQRIYEVQKKTITQYIGLSDKYKKEIYEGDIIICILNGNAIGASDTVTFKNGSFWLNRRNVPISEWYDMENTEFEVIGNIYQP